ncbi:MAG: hypothetical protein HYT19_01290 [Candidatus Nealsonbacteria bacterium]|nr:hypothetical protein [Candidatus Nealsonbacteria bacterium]
MPQEININDGNRPRRRINPLTGQSVLISPQRGFKLIGLNVVAYSSLPELSASCPFCPGNEERTPKELTRVANSLDPEKWLVRGFPNANPLCAIEDGELEETPEFFREYRASGVGASEIIVESPKHNHCLSCSSELEITAIFQALAERYWDLKCDPRFKWFYAFKNYGPDAGASLSHPHWQNEAWEFVPTLIYERWRRMKEYSATNNGECLFCRLWQEEKMAGRVVFENDHFVAFVPFAPSETHQVTIASKEHSPCFASCLQNEVVSLQFAKILKEVMRKVKIVLQGEKWQELSDLPHHFHLFTAPYFNDGNDSPYHWHLEFKPLTTKKAGHERGTGEDAISVYPEAIAKILRDI